MYVSKFSYYLMLIDIFSRGDAKGPTSGDHQVFEFDPKGGYITCGGIPQLVLGVDGEKISLQQRSAKNINQQWSMGDGLVHLLSFGSNSLFYGHFELND